MPAVRCALTSGSLVKHIICSNKAFCQSSKVRLDNIVVSAMQKRLLPLSPNPFVTDPAEISWQIRGKFFHFVASFLRFRAVKQATKKIRKTQRVIYLPWFYGLFILREPQPFSCYFVAGLRLHITSCRCDTFTAGGGT